MIAVPPGLTLPDYLEQTKVWIDGRSGTTYEIDSLGEGRRGYAARELARSATGIISLMEVWALCTQGLVPALQLVAANPREWIIDQPLYKRLAPTTTPETKPAPTATDSVGTARPAPMPGPHLIRRDLAS